MKSERENMLEQFWRWRQSLKRVEAEAARLKCVEIEVLAGVAALAVDDLMKTSMAKRKRRSQASARG